MNANKKKFKSRRKVAPLSLITGSDSIFIKTKPNKITTNYIDSGNKIKSNLFLDKGNNSNLSNHLTEKINTLSSLIFSNKISESNNNGIFSNDFLNDYLNFGKNKLKADILQNKGVKSFIKVVEDNNTSIHKHRKLNKNRTIEHAFLKLNSNVIKEFNIKNDLEKNIASNKKIFNQSTKKASFIAGIKKRKVVNRNKNGSRLKNDGLYLMLMNSYYGLDNFNFAKTGNLYIKSNLINTFDKENINGSENRINENFAAKSSNDSRIHKKKEKSTHKNCLCQQRREIKKPKSFITNLANSNNGLLIQSKKLNKINENNQKNIDQMKHKKIITNVNSSNISLNNSKNNNKNQNMCNHLTDINDDICSKIDLLATDNEINEIDEFSSSMSQKKKVVKSLKIKPNAVANRLKNLNNNKTKIKSDIFNNNQKNIVKNNKFRKIGLINKKSNTSIAYLGQKLNNNNNNIIEKKEKEQIKEKKTENVNLQKIPKIRPPNNYNNSKKLNILSLIQENNQKIRKKSFPKCTPKREESYDIQNVLYDNYNDSNKKEYFDNFDGIYTIIKKINFDEVNIQLNNIFTTNPKLNNLYAEYDQIFSNYFINNIVNKNKTINNMNGNVHSSRISGSTKENSSKGKKTSVSYLFDKN